MLWCITRLPFAWQLAFGRLLGFLVYLFGTDRRRVTRINLELCFPELAGGENRRLVRAHFTSLGIAIIEIALGWWGTERKLRKLVTISGLDNLEKALQQGKGVLLLSAHFTTLEIGGRLLSMHIPFHVLYRRHKNPVIEFLIQKSRTRLYENAIERGDLRTMINSLRNNRPVWYAPDQDSGSDNSIFVPFFGVPAATLTTTSRLAGITGARVVPFFQTRLPGSRGYRLTLLPALEQFPGSSIEADTRRIVELIEDRIRENPEQYIWAHRRFKTR
ncbi:MAG: LpxL/LpxP family Kdo(2)-lipid IV(A) lauroyl/palmitoleoyl acyltransferase, partial [Thiohalobacterales bacterium]